jgi:hypothetical protein
MASASTPLSGGGVNPRWDPQEEIFNFSVGIFNVFVLCVFNGLVDIFDGL